MLESICVNVWLGMLFGSLAEPDQEAFNCKLALVVGQVTDFRVVHDSSSALRPARTAAVAAPRGVEARPPRGGSEDTDEVGTDAPLEFRQAAQAIIVVDVGGGAEDRVAQVSQTHQVEDRELLVRGFYKEVDVAIFPSLVASH
jgi:hypothetical protein